MKNCVYSQEDRYTNENIFFIIQNDKTCEICSISISNQIVKEESIGT